MASKNPTNVWIEPRKGKRGKTWRVRWIDPESGKRRSEACGSDYAFARERRTQIRQRLRDKLLGKIPEVSIDSLVGQLAVLMAGKAADTITKTKA
ncbi:MAG: hypothetical protein QGH60_24200, partial [Phycisphaerae bacterium]|nr:hypothetical protein [Phycisphaerae bacterium]